MFRFSPSALLRAFHRSQRYILGVEREGASDDDAERSAFIHGGEVMPHACFLRQFSGSLTFTQSSSANR